MKRFLTLALIGAVMLGAGSVAYANVCAFDPVPAATLLFPFVTYNYGLGASGYNTLFAVTNVSDEATIAHVTVWTDFSIPILDFNILLTGYDVQTLSIRDILANGQLPVTTIGGHTQTEGVFEDGPVSGANTYGLWDPIDLPDPEATSALSSRCSTNSTGYPGRYTTPIPANILALFEGWLKSSQTVPRYHDNCDANPYVPSPTPWFEGRTGDDDTWMYITVDVVETCNLFFPDDIEYWSTDEPRFENILMGDVIYVNQSARLSEAENAVQIEAAASVEFMATPIPESDDWASFYSRYADAYGYSDYREPLPTAWAFRYMQDDGLGLTTGIRAWKGSTLNRTVPDLYLDDIDESPNEMWARNCVAYTYYVWDENENVSSTSLNPWSMPGGESVILNLLPLETQEVMADQFNILDAYGWFLFIWPPSNFYPGGTPEDWYQTYMGVQYTKAGEYSSFRTGHVMANFNCFEDQVLPQLGILYQPPLD
jgi:hypothetical protein